MNSASWYISIHSLAKWPVGLEVLILGAPLKNSNTVSMQHQTGASNVWNNFLRPRI